MHIDHSKITADLNFVRSEIEQSTIGKGIGSFQPVD